MGNLTQHFRSAFKLGTGCRLESTHLQSGLRVTLLDYWHRPSLSSITWPGIQSLPKLWYPSSTLVTVCQMCSFQTEMI
jgi:hypothetical protein